MATLEIRNVNKSFGGVQALRDVNLTVEAGSVHAIIGPNGAGKSTLLNCIVGKLLPDTGSITFNGQSVLGLRPHEINQFGISRVFQTPEIFPDLTLIDNVIVPALSHSHGAFHFHAWQRTDHQRQIVEEAEHVLEEVGLIKLKDMTAGSLSRGDKRRLELAMCLVQQPKLLLLDEPTAGMSRADTNATIDLLKHIGERRITKVVIEHDMHVVFSLAQKISVMAQGTVLVEGEPAAIKGDPKVQEAYLGGAHL